MELRWNKQLEADYLQGDMKDTRKFGRIGIVIAIATTALLAFFLCRLGRFTQILVGQYKWRCDSDFLLRQLFTHCLPAESRAPCFYGTLSLRRWYPVDHG